MNKIEDIYCHSRRYRLYRVNGVGGNRGDGGPGGVGGSGGGLCAHWCAHVSSLSCPLLR